MAQEPSLNSPIYDPPYESPLEDFFAWNISKCLRESVGLRKQAAIETICGQFRVDFLLKDDSSRTLVFECDGGTYHDFGDTRDEWRDAMIFGTGIVDIIYHLRGIDLLDHIEDCLFLISEWNPELFSERGLINLGILASDHSKGNNVFKTEDYVRVSYPHTTENDRYHIIWVERHLREPPYPGVRWKRLFEFAQNIGGGKLDEIRQKYIETLSQHLLR